MSSRKDRNKIILGIKEITARWASAKPETRPSQGNFVNWVNQVYKYKKLAHEGRIMTDEGEVTGMGYTHYWYRPKSFAPKDFDLFQADCARLIKKINKSGMAIRGPDGEGAPVFTQNMIAFNGSGDNGHETFVVTMDFTIQYEGQKASDTSGLWFECCKTARKPYDLAVMACLIALASYFPEVKVSSDGGNVDWEPARHLCDLVMGYGEDFVLDQGPY